MKHTATSLACLGLSLAVSAQTTNWLLIKPSTAPSARQHAALVYDSARKRTLLFGGTSQATGRLDETWEWNGVVWMKLSPKTAPSGRVGHAMAYDSARRRTVLFGGFATGLGRAADTWEWDGVAWTQINPLTSPPARQGAFVAYDAARKRTVLFGGHGPTATLSDTWEWDGKVWAQANPTTSPSARHSGSMVYDSARQRIVLFGGPGSPGSDAETWEWDGKTWTKMNPTTSPPGVEDHRMAYDAARKRTVLFGGRVVVTPGWPRVPVADTWEWDGKAWTHIKPTASPAKRIIHCMAYDSDRQRVVLFGGYNGNVSTGDTWEYVAFVNAGFKPYGTSCGPVLAAATGSRPLLGSKFTMVVSKLPPTAKTALLSAGVSDQFFGSIPLPLRLDLIGMSGCWLHHSFDAAWLFPVSNGTGTFSGQVPSHPGWAGVRVHFQAAAESVTSNGGQVTMGNQ